MKKKIYLFFLLNLLFNISINLIHPLTPDYVDKLKLSDFYFACLFAFMAFGQTIGAIFWGKLSDKGKKVPLFIIGLVGYAIFQLCFGFINSNTYLILLFRFGSGFFIVAPIALYLVHLIDIVDYEKRGKYLNIFNAIQILGSALGYYLGGFIYVNLNLTIAEIFIFQAVFVTINIILTAGYFSFNNNVIANFVPTKASFKGIKDLPLSHIIFIIALGIATTGNIMILKFADKITTFYYNEEILGLWTLLGAVAGVTCTLLFLSFFSKKEKNLLTTYQVLCILCAVFVIITFISGSKYLLLTLFTSFVLYNIFRILATPVEQTYISQISDNKNRGTILGVRQAFISLGNMLGPLIGAVCYKYNKFSTFYFGALAILFAVLIIQFIKRHQALSD